MKMSRGETTLGITLCKWELQGLLLKGARADLKNSLHCLSWNTELLEGDVPSPCQGQLQEFLPWDNARGKEKENRAKNYLQVLYSALESLWGLPFTFYFILILGLKYCTHTCHVATDGLYLRWSVCWGTWTNEGFIDEWSHLWDCLKLAYTCNCNSEEIFSSLFFCRKTENKMVWSLWPGLVVHDDVSEL